MKRNQFFIFLSALLVVLATLDGCKKKTASKEGSQVSTSEQSRSDTLPSEKFPLKILYAGLPDTDRAKDFVDFLGAHFESVAFTDYNRFSEKDTVGYDVVILDYDGTDTQAPTPTISRDYNRATVTMGVPGADICSRLSLKTGYL